MKAFFGEPVAAPSSGGAQLCIYLVPVFDGRLVCFDVEAREARGRWLPWDVLEFGENPYEAASELADYWCGVSLQTLELADVMSLQAPSSPWELAVIFRAALAEPPVGGPDRQPFIFEPGQYDAIASFDPVDLERWVTGLSGAPKRDAGGTSTPRPGALLF